MKSKGVSDRTLQKYFRKCVLLIHGNMCIICDEKDTDENLQCHHVVHRVHRVLRHNPKNGVPVHHAKPYHWEYDEEGNTRVLTCHEFADTLAGREMVAEKLGGERMEHIKAREGWTVKDFLIAARLSREGMERWELKRLKEIIAKYQGD